MNVQPQATQQPRIAGTRADRPGLLARVVGLVTRSLVERWLGGVHAGLVVKSVYLQRAVGRWLRTGDKAILDAGCGPEGQLAALLARRYPSCSVEGLDLYCAGSGAPSNLSLREADLSRLTKVSAYDLVYSIDVLEHIHDYADVLDRFVRALRPGGWLFMHVPSSKQRNWFAATEAEAANEFREHRAGDDHVREGFDKAELVRELEQRAMTVVEIRWTFNGLTSWVKEIFSLGERRGIPGIGLLLLPAVLWSVLIEMAIAPNRGNGLCVLAIKKGLSAP